MTAEERLGLRRLVDRATRARIAATEPGGRKRPTSEAPRVARLLRGFERVGRPASPTAAARAMRMGIGDLTPLVDVLLAEGLIVEAGRRVGRPLYAVAGCHPA